MTDKEDGLLPPPKIIDPVQTFGHKRSISNGQDLINEQNIRVHINGDRKSEPHVHSRRISFDWGIDKLLKLCKPDDVIEFFRDLFFGKTQHDAVYEDVFPAGNLRMKTRPKFDECGDLSIHLDRSRCGFGNTGDHL